jgi:hypothetical protein
VAGVGNAAHRHSYPIHNVTVTMPELPVANIGFPIPEPNTILHNGNLGP